MNEPSARWMTWSASSIQANSTVPRTRSAQQELPVARHLQAHDVLAPLGLEARALFGRGRHPGPAVLELPLFALGGLALGVHLLGGGVVVVGVAAAQQLVDGGLVARAALRLEVRRERAADLGPFVPVEAEPAEAVEDRRERRLDVALLIGVVDAQHELAAVAPREQPVEQRRAHAADVQEAGRAGREPRARRVGESQGHVILSPGSGRVAGVVEGDDAAIPPPAARIIPSDRPNFICRGFRLATTIDLAGRPARPDRDRWRAGR